MVVAVATLALIPLNVFLWAAAWNMRWLYVRSRPPVAFMFLVQLLRDWNEHRKRIERIEEIERQYGRKPGLYRPRFRPSD